MSYPAGGPRRSLKSRKKTKSKPKPKFKSKPKSKLQKTLVSAPVSAPPASVPVLQVVIWASVFSLLAFSGIVVVGSYGFGIVFTDMMLFAIGGVVASVALSGMVILSAQKKPVTKAQEQTAPVLTVGEDNQNAELSVPNNKPAPSLFVEEPSEDLQADEQDEQNIQASFIFDVQCIARITEGDHLIDECFFSHMQNALVIQSQSAVDLLLNNLKALYVAMDKVNSSNIMLILQKNKVLTQIINTFIPMKDNPIHSECVLILIAFLYKQRQIKEKEEPKLKSKSKRRDKNRAVLPTDGWRWTITIYIKKALHAQNAVLVDALVKQYVPTDVEMILRELTSATELDNLNKTAQLRILLNLEEGGALLIGGDLELLALFYKFANSFLFEADFGVAAEFYYKLSTDAVRNRARNDLSVFRRNAFDAWLAKQPPSSSAVSAARAGV